MEIKYALDGKVAEVDGYVFVRDNKTNYYLSSRRIDGKRKRLHVYMWEKYNGEIPKGHQIHHVDHDKSNNEISNLKLMTNSEHQRLHALSMSEETKAKMRKSLIEKAVPASKKWHASEEGKKWHAQHGRDTWKKREEKEYECSFCGEKFLTKNRYSEGKNRFCSNNCKSAFRRKSGVDDIEAVCKVCGEVFVKNKYAKVARCQACRSNRL